MGWYTHVYVLGSPTSRQLSKQLKGVPLLLCLNYGPDTRSLEPACTFTSYAHDTMAHHGKTIQQGIVVNSRMFLGTPY